MTRFCNILCGGACAVVWTLSGVSGAPGPALETVAPEKVGLSAEHLDDITEFLDREVQSGRIAGAVGLLARHGKVGYFEAVGFSDLEARIPMTTDVLFRIASMTKAITSAAVMMLVEEGTIALEDPVSKYLPEFDEPTVLTDTGTTEPAPRPPTIHELLTHTSGIGYGWFGPEAQDLAYRRANVADILVPIDETIEERVERLANQPLAFHPGEQWAYGLSIDVLGRVLEVVTGLNVDQFFRERIFRPLGMADTHFYVPERKRDRLATLYTPDEERRHLLPVDSDIVVAGPVRFTGDFCFQGMGRLFAGGSGLVSSTMDYARFLQMLLDDGESLLAAETVARMTRNQIGDQTIPFPGHGDGFGYGVGVLTERGRADDPARVGTYSWGGIFNSYFWVDPQEEFIGVLMVQVFPNDHLDTRAEFKRLAYEAIDEAGFSRLYWYEPGIEHGNPFFNGRQLRVNARGTGVHESFAGRSEVRSSGLARILIDEDLRSVRRAALYCEVWGGHPGTANHRVTINGWDTKPFPDLGTGSGHCTHGYITFNLMPGDLVNGYNSLQFACDHGTTFWGHYIVDNSCLKIGVEKGPDPGMSGFMARVKATRLPLAESVRLELDATDMAEIVRVDYQARYTGYDENGDGRETDWHGMTRDREPYGHLGGATEPPFALEWDTRLIPAQSELAFRAVVRLRDRPEWIYETSVTAGPAIDPRPKHRVSFHRARDVPAPFWSRADRRLTCSIPVDVEPASVEAAELHVVTWTGGAGEVEDYFTLNGHGMKVAEGHGHQVEYSRVSIDPAILRRGDNEIVLRSDTKHHGIEVLRPGPALMIRTRR